MKLAAKQLADDHKHEVQRRQQEQNAEVRSQNAAAQESELLKKMRLAEEQQYSQLKKSEEHEVAKLLKPVQEKGEKKGEELGQRLIDQRKREQKEALTKSLRVGIHAGLTNAELVASEPPH